MKIKGRSIKPGSEDDDFVAEEWNRYKKYTPKELSPYQAVNKYIVMPALELHLAELNMTKKEYLNQNGGVGVLSRINLTSTVYDELVRTPVKAYLINNGAYQIHEANFKQTKKGLESTNYEVDLEKYVFSKKDVKDTVRRYVVGKVLPDAARLISDYTDVIDEYKKPYEASAEVSDDDLDI